MHDFHDVLKCDFVCNRESASKNAVITHQLLKNFEIYG